MPRRTTRRPRTPRAASKRARPAEAVASAAAEAVAEAAAESPAAPAEQVEKPAQQDNMAKLRGKTIAQLKELDGILTGHILLAPPGEQYGKTCILLGQVKQVLEEKVRAAAE